MTEGLLPCEGGPFDKQLCHAGDDVPEWWRITVSVGRMPPMGTTFVPADFKDVRTGTYTSKGNVLIWSEGIK